jgi:hypothetical protein
LQLLLALSSSSNQNYDYIPSVREKDDKNTLTWQEVIKDDPLEGDHWQNWPEDSSSEGYISDSDGFEMEENQTVNNNPVPQVCRQRIKMKKVCNHQQLFYNSSSKIQTSMHLIYPIMIRSISLVKWI